jgi:uncharacterized FAD-dependent dehydrogenase
MLKIIDVAVPPEVAYNEELLKAHLQKIVGRTEPFYFQVQRRSIDARGKHIKLQLKIQLTDTPNNGFSLQYDKNQLPDVSNAAEVGIIGFGPAGMFAALRLIELGHKPVVFERGKDVRSRRRDIATINKAHTVHPDSNYCFGEGGAGTYSDGKLYTRSTKRGDIQRILEILVDHGATDQILVDSHPHIGTNKLPNVVAAIRDTIIAHGGKIHFETRVEDLIIENSTVKGVKLNGGAQFYCQALIAATGHSARDFFRLLQRKNILIEAKPFALGVRIEHPQQLIDSIQYHCDVRYPPLPAAAYSLVAQTPSQRGNVGVFSFCMCPGGFIVPAATAEGEVVVNGMSPSRRDSKYANSGIVVQVDQSDWQEFDKYGALAAMEYQSRVEQAACMAAGGTQAAPAQRLMDFMYGKTSTNLPECSYQPGLVSINLNEVLPSKIHHALRYGFKQFGRRMKGYCTNEAVLVGVESRTSSPVKIPRDKDTLQHPQLAGFFPGGEGAGFAGGIMSAAMDGEKLAEAVHRWLMS